MKKIISILLTLAMTMSMITIPTLAEELTEIEKVIADNTILTEPFDVTNEEEVDAGLYPYDEKTVLVKFAKKTSSLDVKGIASIEYLFKAKDGFWYTAYLTEGTTPKMAIEALRSTSSVLVAEYNFLYETGATTLCDNEGVSADVSSNGKSKDQWYLDSCGLQNAWKYMKKEGMNPGGSSGIVVAVIDTGVDYTHEDLASNMWANSGEIPGDGRDNDGNGYVDDYFGVNIVTKKGNGDDDHGHGTHVAGIIAAANNNVGIVGIAYNTKIMAIKAGQASGYFLSTDICKAVDYARENGADVINMSFGGVSPTIAVQDALEEAYTHSVLVAAAGNDGANNEPTSTNPTAKPCYPAAYSFVLGVMAVDDFGTETSFTNYDVYGFNSVEYELYAPGNEITSTIPNDKYATWNGTSMAAPIVSGMAAILKSVYNDPDKYPTKFIYGQLASTSERRAECLAPRLHEKHNLPQIANLYDALTKMPKPDVSVSEYKTFDTSAIHVNNNGDGTIDAGEVIALGFELRNRWGMSEDTIVTINALSSGQVANPYVEFSTDRNKYYDSVNINYGSIGTYSTQDCGKIIEKDLWTGWEKPFYVKVAKDTPNDTIITINLTITAKNGLDKEDKTLYESEAYMNIVVKRGTVLPQIIKEDITLTKDNYYIIQNSTVIEEGATVTVTEGTNIQFWTNDSTDPYADNYIAGLVVKGKLNCIGTEEEPVKIFPSDLMGSYEVNITQNSGEVNLYYTNITNPYVVINSAEKCEFNQKYKGTLLYRYLKNGIVQKSQHNTYVSIAQAKDCAIYRIGTNADVNGDYENCIFVDSSIRFSSSGAYDNCVFYGNNNYWDSINQGGISNMEPYNKLRNCRNAVTKIAKDEVAGRTYLVVGTTVLGGTSNLYQDDLIPVKKVAEYLGGTLCMIETEEELEFLKNAKIYGTLGAEKKDGKFVWINDEELGDFINITNPSSSYKTLYFDHNKGIKIDDSYYGSTIPSFIIEIPDEIHIEELSFAKTSVSMDTSVAYQANAQVYPSTAKDHKLLYFSSNEAVAKVDENGLVTSVETGTATIYVFSEDMQVSASMTVEVKDEVKAKSIKAPETMQINIGTTSALNAVIKPANTTKQATYSSSDEAIATVDADGNITAVSKGEAIITTSVSNGDEVITAETLVSVVIPAKEITFEKSTIYIKTGDEKEVFPLITPENATNKNIIWDSSNPEVCYVNEDGEIVGVSAGMATIKATVENTDISSYITVGVSDDYITLPEIVKIRNYVNSSIDMNYIITEDGQLWHWGKFGNYGSSSGDIMTISNPVKMELTYNNKEIKVADIAFRQSMTTTGHYMYCAVLDQDGVLYERYIDNKSIAGKCSLSKVTENVKKIIVNDVNPLGKDYIVIYKDGTVAGYGHNYFEKFGIGSGVAISEGIIVSLENGEKVIDGYNNSDYSVLLTENGNLYRAGYFGGKSDEYYTKVYEGVKEIKNNIAYTDTHYFSLHTSDTTLYPIKYQDMIDHSIYIEDGKIYRHNYNSDLEYVLNLKNIKNVIKVRSKYYFITDDNELYYINTSDFTNDTIPVFVMMNQIEEAENLILRRNDTNMVNPVYNSGGDIISATLKEDNLIIGFNEKIDISDEYNNIILKTSGSQYAIKKSVDLNNLIISLPNGFKVGAEYTLTIPAGAFANRSSKRNAFITVTFTYQPDEEIEEEIPEVPEEEEESTEPKHTHEFETETVIPTLDAEGKIKNICECGVTSETILPKLTERDGFTEEDYTRLYNEFVEKGFNTNVSGSAILNRLNDDDVTKWLRITAPSGEAKYGFGGNYWGTTNPELINYQIVDYNDFITLGDINEGEFLTTAPENTFPFVAEAYLLDAAGEVQSIVSGGKVKFVVKFNRDMDMDYGAKVFFGSSYPYAEYEIEGSFTDARTWVGETELKTVIENGYQFIRVTNGRTKADENGAHLKLYDDWARFGFEIDTTSAMAMMMQGYADNEGIHLEWMQDDYDTLAGYNVYRAETEDGNYVRINKTVIPSEENTFFDTGVEPGKKYYYTFTVVLTDASESKPAGKISVTAKDTMAPSVYHSPVYTATTGNKVIISATVSDNIGIENAKLYYRVKGTEEWKTLDMSKSNSKYTASIPAAFVTTEGVEYYIAAFDGVNYTYAGSHTSENPYEITVYQAVENNAKGDVDGDGNITVLDALKLLRAIYDESLLTQEEFLRADINGDGSLSAVEALRILQYANKTISSVLW